MAVERREVCLSLSRLKKILLQSTFRLKKLLSRLKLNLSVSRFRQETHVEVHTEETETAVNIETEDTDHEGVGEVLKRPVKKTKMISELVCVVEPKTRSAKAKKGTRRGRKR